MTTLDADHPEHQRDQDVPDVAEIEVPLGGRALIVGDLRLTATTTPERSSAVRALGQAVRSWSGPGTIIINGGLFEAGAAVADTLSANPQVVTGLKDFASAPGRQVLVLPGARDAFLAWDTGAQREVRDRLGATIAISAEVLTHTGGGIRRVRVEPGHRFDEMAARNHPRDPVETPLSDHLQHQIDQRLHTSSSETEPGKRDWLGGLETLDNPSSFPYFLASRLVYRRLGRYSWLLALPFVAVFVLRLPMDLWWRAHHSAVGGVLLGLVMILIVFGLIVLAVRRSWSALAGVTGQDHRGDPNSEARAAARALIEDGAAGLVVAHTCKAEMAGLGEGFFAAVGCVGPVVTEYPTRLPGLGLPGAYLASERVGWLEIDAGSNVHARLLYSESRLPGASLLERVATRGAKVGDAGRPEVVAHFPGCVEWPEPTKVVPRQKLVRRLAALFVGISGVLSLLSVASDPLRDQLSSVYNYLPVFPRIADALTALVGVGLLILARGVRRGQRRAWAVCLVSLLAVAVFHIARASGLEGMIVALGAAGFLWINRRYFRAASDIPPVRKGVLSLLGTAVVAALAGTVSLKITYTLHHRPPFRHHLSWIHALQASSERLVGIQHVVLNPRVERFFTPAMGVVGIALGLALLVLLLRPVVHRRSQHEHEATPWVAGAGTPNPDLARAREVVDKYGSGTLDFFALRDDKQYFFWNETVVAYAVYNGSCLVSPDPVGPETERVEAWRAFRKFVDSNGWALGGLGAGEDWLPIYRDSGMHDVYVGDEGVVNVQDFSMQGGKFKGLRQAVNRVAKYGYTISFHDPANLDPAVQAELAAVMTKSRQGDVERGFSMTLGRVFDPADKGLLMAVVRAPADGAPANGSGAPDGRSEEGGEKAKGSAEDRAVPASGQKKGKGPKGKPGGGTVTARVEPGDKRPVGPIVAFCQYVPAPGIGGYSLDLMRRDSGEHPNGLIDFTVVETINYLKEKGYEALGLNFATMRAVLAGEAGDNIARKAQAWVLRRMGESMQIESLWRFNAKFSPYWQPRYAIYDAPENAMATAIAMARAESWWELPIIGRLLTPSGSDSGSGGSGSGGSSAAQQAS